MCSAWDGWWRSELGAYCKSQRNTRPWKPQRVYLTGCFRLPSGFVCFLPPNVVSSARRSISGAGTASPQGCPLLRAALDTSTLPVFSGKAGSFPGGKSALAVRARGVPGSGAVAPAGTSSHNQERNHRTRMCLADVRLGPDTSLLDSLKNLFLYASPSLQRSGAQFSHLKMCLEVRRVPPVFLNAVLDAFGHTRPKDAAISDLRMCKEGESTFRCYQPVASAQEARTRDLCVPAVSEQDPHAAPLRVERKSQLIIFNRLLEHPPTPGLILELFFTLKPK